jgi:glycosyltransferase involved in cell wall biosynthesis
MRIFTGSPHPFIGDQAFFDRDSGLLSCGFETLGISSGVITLGSATACDLPAMNHGTWKQMEDPDWWSNLNLDGLVFISWGNWRFRRMVTAAMKAGIHVAQMTDTQGIQSPVSDWRAHLQAEGAHYWYEPRWKQICRTVAKLPITLTARIAYRDLRDAGTIASSDYFLAPTPRAAERYGNLTRRLQSAEASRRVRFVPFPVNFHFKYLPEILKIEEVIAVGRWDSSQKRTPLLIATISRALAQRSTIRFRIFGKISLELQSWHQALVGPIREQVSLEGNVSSSTLAAAYQRARVILVSSAYEGCHNASAEAICCGATVVGCRSPFLGVLEWHAGKNSGRLAEQATPDSLSQALLDELDAWNHGQRDPAAISRDWTQELHADRVAARILELFSELPSRGRI